MHKIAVLLSTYNGEKYLEEQIHSIFKQNNCEIFLYVRDDGSNDKTLEILNKLKKTYNLTIVQGNNLGWKESFFQLLYLVPDIYDYYAFSDQDDVWMPEKLNRAIKMIENVTRPCLYCSAQTFVNEQLDYLSIDIHKHPKNSRQAMTNISSRGCSEVFNQKLLKILQNEKVTTNFSHDRWVARVAIYAGMVVLDDESYTLYRQHGNNSSGNNFQPSLRSKIRNLLSNYRKHDFYYWYALELLEKYSDFLKVEDKLWLEKLVGSKKNIKNKLELLFSKDFVSETVKGTIILKLVMAFGLYQSEKNKGKDKIK